MWVNMLGLVREAAESRWVDGIYILYIPYSTQTTQQLHLLSLLQAKKKELNWIRNSIFFLKIDPMIHHTLKTKPMQGPCCIPHPRLPRSPHTDRLLWRHPYLNALYIFNFFLVLFIFQSSSYQSSQAKSFHLIRIENPAGYLFPEFPGDDSFMD